MDSLYRRPSHTYEVPDSTIKKILMDEASPIKRVIESLPDNKKILDIGAGSGLIGKIIQQSNRDIIIDGIEPSEAATDIAKKYYRNFYAGYCQDFWSEIENNEYDYVVLADVIEHIIDPQEFLTDLLKHLKKDCKIIFSVPNVAFGAIRISLLNGDFDYVDSGLLEKTHLRFFTKKSLINMLGSININIELLGYLQRSIHKTEVPLEQYITRIPRKISNDSLFYTYQFFVIGTQESVSLREETHGTFKKFRGYMLWRKRIKSLIKRLSNK
jgi:2-polyprenyl-3-methyl-5-hydroxy-6-metoxy-1,4-benzoquinol methylase